MSSFRLFHCAPSLAHFLLAVIFLRQSPQENTWLPTAIQHLEEFIEVFGVPQISLSFVLAVLHHPVTTRLWHQGPTWPKKGQKLCYLGFMLYFIAVRARVQHVLLLMSLRFIRHACRHFTKRAKTGHPKCASTTWPRPGATWCVPTDTVSLSARA